MKSSYLFLKFFFFFFILSLFSCGGGSPSQKNLAIDINIYYPLENPSDLKKQIAKMEFFLRRNDLSEVKKSTLTKGQINNISIPPCPADGKKHLWDLIFIGYQDKNPLAKGRLLIDYACREKQPFNIFVGKLDEFSNLSLWNNGSVAPAQMLIPRFGHQATRLADGRILITGGIALKKGLNLSEILPNLTNVEFVKKTEIYDPIAGTLTEGPKLMEERAFHTATLLKDGSILIIGGIGKKDVLPIEQLNIVGADFKINSFDAIKLKNKFLHTTSSIHLPQFEGLLVVGGLSLTKDSKRISNEHYLIDLKDLLAGKGLQKSNIQFISSHALQKAFTRFFHTITPLNLEEDHGKRMRWVITGGIILNSRKRPQISNEVYQIVFESGQLSLSKDVKNPDFLKGPRYGHTAIRLPEGRIAIVGGAASFKNENFLAPKTLHRTLEIISRYGKPRYRFQEQGQNQDPSLLDLKEEFAFQHAALLYTGQLLVFGGISLGDNALKPQRSALLIDLFPVPIIRRINSLQNPHLFGSTAFLNNHSLLVFGGLFHPEKSSQTEIFITAPQDNPASITSRPPLRSCFAGSKTQVRHGICQEGYRLTGETECYGQILPNKKEVSNNGVDDDCNGLIDENGSCQNGKKRNCLILNTPGRCREGLQRCQNGRWGSCQPKFHPTTETCNNLDDDCDGKTDEDVVKECELCQKQKGLKKCVQGGRWGPCLPIHPLIEKCHNDKDDDCDGKIDEGCLKFINKRHISHSLFDIVVEPHEKYIGAISFDNWLKVLPIQNLPNASYAKCQEFNRIGGISAFQTDSTHSTFAIMGQTKNSMPPTLSIQFISPFNNISLQAITFQPPSLSILPPILTVNTSKNHFFFTARIVKKLPNPLNSYKKLFIERYIMHKNKIQHSTIVLEDVTSIPVRFAWDDPTSALLFSAGNIKVNSREQLPIFKYSSSNSCHLWRFSLRKSSLQIQKFSLNSQMLSNPLDVTFARYKKELYAIVSYIGKKDISKNIIQSGIAIFKMSVTTPSQTIQPFREIIFSSKANMRPVGVKFHNGTLFVTLQILQKHQNFSSYLISFDIDTILQGKPHFILNSNFSQIKEIKQYFHLNITNKTHAVYFLDIARRTNKLFTVLAHPQIVSHSGYIMKFDINK